VEKLLNNMDEECEGIRENAFSLAWYMRGGVSYEDVLNMSSKERGHITKLVNSNLEVTKNSKLPFF
jgi:hypothetical protein